MSDFKKFGGGRNNRGGGGRGFGRPSFGGDRSDFHHGGQRSEMFTATCDECGKQCDVPFKPNGKKPVYCQDCFDKRRGVEPGDYHKKDSFANSTRRDFSGGSDSKPRDDKRIDDLKKQVDNISAKLDRLLAIMDKPDPVVAAPKMKEIKITPFKLAGADEDVTEEDKPVVKKAAAKKKAPAKKKA